MWKVIVTLLILIPSFGAFAQGDSAVSQAEINVQIDQEKYAHPDDFFYEEKIENEVKETYSPSAEELQYYGEPATELQEMELQQYEAEQDYYQKNEFVNNGEL